MRPVLTFLILTLSQLCSANVLCQNFDFILPKSVIFNQVSQDTKLNEELSGTLELRSSSSDNNVPFFIIGLVALPFTLVCIWKNEKKVVTYHRFILEATKAVKSIASHPANESTNLALVHVQGRAINNTVLVDKNFNVQAHDSFKLSRTVEMYQTKEIAHKKKDRDYYTYTYEEGWFDHPIESSTFHDPTRRNDNPSPSAFPPFQSYTNYASQVILGGFFLSPKQIECLASLKVTKLVLDGEKIGLDQINYQRQCANLPPFTVHGEQLISSAQPQTQQIDLLHRGQYRISFNYSPCDNVSVMAQQVQDNGAQFTFRKWNPKKLSHAYGQDTSAEEITKCSGCCGCICQIVNGFFSSVMEEAVDFVEIGEKSSQFMLTKHDDGVFMSCMKIRIVSILLCMLSLWFILIPFGKLLAFIPLMGWLLSAVYFIASFVFSIVVGGTLAFLVMAIAWLWFRPLLGVGYLVLMTVGLCFIFLFPFDQSASMIEANQ